VRARDTEGRLGPPGQEARATTSAAEPTDVTAPSRPGRTRGQVVGSRAVRLSWAASEDDTGVLSYDVHQGPSKMHSVGGARTATVVTGLRPGTRYAFTVRARDASDNASAPGDTVRLTTPLRRRPRHRARHLPRDRAAHSFHVGRGPRCPPRPDPGETARRQPGRVLGGAGGDDRVGGGWAGRWNPSPGRGPSACAAACGDVGCP